MRAGEFGAEILQVDTPLRSEGTALDAHLPVRRSHPSASRHDFA